MLTIGNVVVPVNVGDTDRTILPAVPVDVDVPEPPLTTGKIPTVPPLPTEARLTGGTASGLKGPKDGINELPVRGPISHIVIVPECPSGSLKVYVTVLAPARQLGTIKIQLVNILEPDVLTVWRMIGM